MPSSNSPRTKLGYDNRTQCFLSFYVHSTQSPLSSCFIGLNTLCLYVLQDSTSFVFMFCRTQHPLSLCFVGLNVLCLYVSQDSTPSIFIFSQDSTSSVFMFHKTQRHLSLCFNILCLYFSQDSMSSVFMFHHYKKNDICLRKFLPTYINYCR